MSRFKLTAGIWKFEFHDSCSVVKWSNKGGCRMDSVCLYAYICLENGRHACIQHLKYRRLNFQNSEKLRMMRGYRPAPDEETPIRSWILGNFLWPSFSAKGLVHHRKSNRKGYFSICCPFGCQHSFWQKSRALSDC